MPGAALVLAFLLSLMMMIPNTAYAGHTATEETWRSQLAAIIVIWYKFTDAAGNKYDVVGISGRTQYDCANQKSCNTAMQAQTTLTGGDFRDMLTPPPTFTEQALFFSRTKYYGIWSTSDHLCLLDHTNFTIDGAPGFGSALLGGKSTFINIKGGTFVAKNCANTGNEGEADGATFNVSDGAQILLENNV